MNTKAEITLDDMVSCIEREIGMRERVYPRWVEQKKLLQATADQEMARMRAVRDLLLTVKNVKAELRQGHTVNLT